MMRGVASPVFVQIYGYAKTHQSHRSSSGLLTEKARCLQAARRCPRGAGLCLPLCRGANPAAIGVYDRGRQPLQLPGDEVFSGLAGSGGSRPAGDVGHSARTGRPRVELRGCPALVRVGKGSKTRASGTARASSTAVGRIQCQHCADSATGNVWLVTQLPGGGIAAADRARAGGVSIGAGSRIWPPVWQSRSFLRLDLSVAPNLDPDSDASGARTTLRVVSV